MLILIKFVSEIENKRIMHIENNIVQKFCKCTIIQYYCQVMWMGNQYNSQNNNNSGIQETEGRKAKRIAFQSESSNLDLNIERCLDTIF